MVTFLKKIPGFRSGIWWKALIATISYLSVLLTILAFSFPTAPSLALDEIKPTNKSSVSVAGKTFIRKPVFLVQSDKIIQSGKADSSGRFYFAINDLKDGSYTYTIEACDSENRKRCRSENLLLVVDQTPPIKPTVTLPDKLPDDSEGKIVLKGASEPNTKILAYVQNDTLPVATANDKGEFEISTGLVLGKNTMSVKAVDDVGNESEVADYSLDFNPNTYKTRVLRVVDGDTIKIEGDKAVRYIGIDTPEVVHPSKPVQCYGKEASSENRELVEGKEVKLEKDVSETDKYGRLLRYIWLGDTLVNEYLVREGYAHSSSYPPDVKYQNRFIEAERQARERKKGLWGDICNPSQTFPPTTVPTQNNQPTTQPTTPSPQQSQPTTSGSYVCNCSKTCAQMSSCAEAQYQLNVCGCKARDADKDGVACDSDCQ